jgi:uncharacterized protein (DUF433 family)
METNVTLEQLAQELEQVKRELREVKEQYATTQNENVAGTIVHQPQKVTVGKSTRIEYPTDHPHIYTSPDMHGGEPTIRGSAISVRDIVERTRLGDSPERMLQGYPHLSLAKIYDALSYYYDHTEEIDKYIRENEEAGWRALHRAST